MPATSAARRNFEIIVVITFPCLFLRSGAARAKTTRFGRIAEGCRLTFFLFSFSRRMEQSTLCAMHK